MARITRPAKISGIATHTTKATAVIVSTDFPAIAASTLRSGNPYLAFAHAVEIFYKAPKPAPGADASARIADSARIGEGASIGPYVVIEGQVKIKRGNRILTLKRRKRVYKYGRCATKGSNVDGVPVTISILDGSYALLDFGAFQRQAPVSGKFRGLIPGKIQLNADTQVNLTKGSLEIGKTSVFIDDDCNGQVSPSIRTGSPATVGLDPTRSSVATLFASGTVTSTAYTTIHLPLDASTRLLIGAAELALMKPTAFLINTARGGIVDEQALTVALLEKRLAGAALDVYAIEPPVDRGLFALPNFLGTPHIGGSTEEAALAMGRAAIAGLDDPGRQIVDS